jgi:hypothetical protein
MIPESVRRFHRVTRIDADLRVGAGQWEQHPDDNVLARLGNGRSGQAWHSGEG